MRHPRIFYVLSLAACGNVVTAPATGGSGGADHGGTTTTTDAGSGDAPDLPTCTVDTDCFATSPTATCQEGYCCAGTLQDGACTCGAGPACDVLHGCCKLCADPPDAAPACRTTCNVLCPPPGK